MTMFNIEKSVNVDAEIEKGCKARVSHLWDDAGNCLQERLGVQRWMNIKAVCEYLLKDSSAISGTTECGVTVYRGRV